MPHNLYLHSALVQSPKLQKNERSVRNAIFYNTIDTTVALAIASATLVFSCWSSA